MDNKVWATKELSHVYCSEEKLSQTLSDLMFEDKTYTQTRKRVFEKPYYSNDYFFLFCISDVKVLKNTILYILCGYYILMCVLGVN